MPRAAAQPEAATAAAGGKVATTAAVNGAAKSNDDSSASITFAQRLAHSDLSVRTANLKRLSSFLHRRTPIPPPDLAKIYKGLFYTFWLSDKPLVQQAMAERLAAMQDGMRESRWMDVVRGYWVMMRREWTGIDRLRLDKYMTWVRCMLAHSLRYLSKRRWDEALVGQWMDCMAELPLANNQTQRGLFLHTADIFVTELGRVLDEHGAGGLEWSVLERLLRPFCEVVATCGDASMVKRVEEEVFEALYTAGAADDDGQSALHELVTGNADRMADKLFALASDKSTLNKNRTRLYKLRDMWQSLQRKVAAEERKQPAAEPSAGAGSKRRGGELTTAVGAKAKKRKAAEEEADDEVPMLVELDQNGHAKVEEKVATKSKKRKAEVADDSAMQEQKQAEPATQRKKKQPEAEPELKDEITQPERKRKAKKGGASAAAEVELREDDIANGSVFADAAEFEVPEFGYDEAEEEGEDEGEEEEDDDMTAILEAEADGQDDSFAQEEDGDKEYASDEDTVDGMTDGEDFMGSDALDQLITQADDEQPSDGEAPPAAVGKRAAAKQSNGGKAANGQAIAKSSGGKRGQAADVVESAEDEEEASEAEAERRAEAEMEGEEPPKRRTKKQKQADAAVVVADSPMQNRPQQNGKRKASKAPPQEEEVKQADEQTMQSRNDQPQSRKQRKRVAQVQVEEEKTAPAPAKETEEKQQSTAATASTSSSPFATPRPRNKSRSTSSPSPKPAVVTTTTTTTTTTITSSSSSSASPSTPSTSRTPKRVSISLEHNRVQSFHHWKPMQVKDDDSTPSSNRTAPKSALKRQSLGGGDADASGSRVKAVKGSGVRMSLPAMPSGGGGGGVKTVGSPRRPTAADFF